MKRAHRKGFAALSLFTGLAWASAAVAEVALEHSVQKVVHGVAADGSTTTTLGSAEKVVPGDELVYTIVFTNTGTDSVDAGTVILTNPIPAELEYLPGTAFGAGTEITFSVDGGKTFAVPDALRTTVDGVDVVAPPSAYTTVRWVFGPALAPGASSHVSFHARLK